jgi:type IV pilus assembly protein PilF
VDLKLQSKMKGLVALLVLLAGTALGGCITTTEGGFTEKASAEKAFEERISLARQYVGKGDWEDAKRNLQIAYKMDPDNYEVHEVFALVYQSTGEYELAEEHFKSSIKIHPACSRCRNNYAAFLYSRGEYEEAESQLEEVIKDTLYSARPRAFQNLGMCRLQLVDRPGAEEAFERALAMNRTNQLALIELAHLRYEAGDYATAAIYYQTWQTVVGQQSARGLLLGIRLAQSTGDRDAEASFVLALGSRYPASPEYKDYLEAAQGD